MIDLWLEPEALIQMRKRLHLFVLAWALEIPVQRLIELGEDDERRREQRRDRLQAARAA